MLKKLYLIFILAVLIISCDESTDPQSNYDPPDDHTVNIEGRKHKPGFNDPEKNCTGCHGENLRGGETAPSCYTCHGKKW